METNAKFGIGFLLAGLVLFMGQCKPDPTEPTPTPPAYGTPAPLERPAGFPPLNIPADNPQTVEGVELGRHLFYDKKLSADLSMSCASCHQQFRAFSDGDPTSIGVDGKRGRRQSMVLFNLVFQKDFFWDGRARSLEEQSLHPITDPLELNTNLPTVIGRLEADPDYPDMFKAAFGDQKITEERIGKAIAQFERTMISANSEFDKVKRISGNMDAPFIEDPNTPGSKNRGFELFSTERADCFHCHSVDVDGAFMGGGFGTDGVFLNNGLKDHYVDEGRKEVTHKDSDWGKFKVPSVRNVEFSAPYMHDGSIPNLDSIIAFYDFGGFLNPGYTDPNMKFAGAAAGTRNFTAQEIEDLKEFLGTLTDYEFLEDPRFSDPFEE